MNEIIRVKKAAYDRYEELLMRRDALKKEAFLQERAYIREFGDLILENFRLKLECIRKKKMIEFCQASLNHGKNVNRDLLQVYLDRELAAFQKQFDEMMKDTEAAKNAGKVTELELLQIKRIYHKLVRMIHPDVNPLLEDSEELQELWQMVVTAYNCNDLKLMQEAEVLIIGVLEKLGNVTIDIDIPDIDGKIKELETEIIRIRETDPYQYKFLLGDPEAVQMKTDDLKAEKKSYEEYSNQLEEILQELLGNGVNLTWRMN